jgi:ABC-type Mn2+/Zn2+ transport system permease subunit
VIGAFLESWPLFHNTYLAGAAMAVGLAAIGVWVVARDQLFLGAAISQASTLGISLLLWLEWLGASAAAPWLGSRAAADACAVAASITTALATWRPPRPGGESAEARTAWIFLLAAAVPVLLLAHSPHGLEEVHRLMFSTLLGATAADVVVFGTVAVATAAAIAVLHRRLLLYAMDPEMAAAVGLRTALWGRAIAVWLGLAIGLSIRVSGLVFTFGCLVLPALAAKNLCREMRPVLWLAPLLALATSIAAFVVANAIDVPPAHATVTGLCGLVAASWLVRRR